MRVLPVDLRGASDTELADLRAIRRASTPAGLPVLDRAVPGGRTACWVSYDGEQAVGALSLVLPAGTSEGYVRLDVDPARRRQGAARQLLTEAVRTAWALGRTGLHARCADDGPGPQFAQAVGSTRGAGEDLLGAVDPMDAPDVDGVDVAPVEVPDVGPLLAQWAPQATPPAGSPTWQAIERATGRRIGLAARDDDGTAFVVLAPDTDPAVAALLAARVVAGAGPAPSVWMPRTSSAAGAVLAGRTAWSLDVPASAARLGMC